MKNYIGDNFEKVAVFKHPQKQNAKEKLEALPAALKNPYKTLKLWIKWEQLDITAILEAVEMKHSLESRKQVLATKKSEAQKELEKLNKG